jgi:ribosomal protein L24E
MRWCKSCCKGPAHSKDFCKVKQGPVDFWFCSERCVQFWVAHRYDPKFAKWLKMPATDRLSSLNSDHE